MAKKFDFLSPGVEIREIDQSFNAALVDAEGPIIIGRTRKGPANKPVKIRNLDDYVSVFGLPVAGGNGALGDMWREGNLTGPTYASYAAQSWLASEESPVTVVRIAGEQHPDAATDAARAGWKLSGSLTTVQNTNSTAYGLFVVASASVDAMTTGSLAAVFYANRGNLVLSGSKASDSAATASVGTFIKSAANKTFTLGIKNQDDSDFTELSFNFDRNSSSYLRSVFNTNPQLVNEDTIETSQRKSYWLGESFSREVDNLGANNDAASLLGMLLPLEKADTNVNWSYHKESASESRTGWVISQKEKGQSDLFRFKSLHVGEDIQRNYMIAIEDIKEPSNTTVNAFGTFTVCIKDMNGSTIEKYSGCNLNPSSENYVGKRIGDQFIEWSESARRYRTYGDFQNQSNIVYIDIKQFVKDGGGQGHLPAGFKGHVRPKGFTLAYGSKGAQTLADNVNTGTKAKTTLTFADQGSLATSTIKLVVDGVDFTITNTNGASDDVAWTGSGAGPYTATIDGSAGSALGYANKVFVLLNQIDTTNWTASGNGTTTLVLEAKVAGPHRTVVYSETGDDSQNAVSAVDVVGTDTDDFAGVFVKGNDSTLNTGGDADLFVEGPTNFTASFNFPSLPLRRSGSDGGASDPYRVYWGMRPKISNDSTANDPDFIDYLRRIPYLSTAEMTKYDAGTAPDDFEHSFVFTLDDIKINTSSNIVTYVSGAHGLTGGNQSYSGANDFKSLLEKNVRQFVMPLWGGSEGFDITEKEPLRDDLISATRNDVTDHIHYSINKALDSVSDPEIVPANLLLIPGIKKPSVTDRVIATAESRKDVLAIIDLENDYKPSAERITTDTEQSSLGDVTSAITSIKNRSLNSSFASAFYPAVQVVDNLNQNKVVWIPASVAALGAFGRSQAQSELWFAPAGFNRGGLGNLGGPRGPKVLQARQRLDSKERDLLYEVNINPIATFPAEGVVVFGQKTLQEADSALNRINVRRLVLFLKSRVSEISRNLLFDQNIESTWRRFRSQVEPVLSSTKARFGLSDYQLVLDETTTTADLVDRNIMYAKIFIKPARAIEYIVVDFVITRTGADFT